MKKLVAIVVALCVLCAGLCLAAGFDFSAYNNDELLVLLGEVQQEIADRKIAKSASLMGGKYTAGKDIPTGKYIFRCTYKGDLWANFTIYADNGNGKQKEWEIITADEGDFEQLVTLEEGDVLSCDQPFTLTVYAGVMFN